MGEGPHFWYDSYQSDTGLFSVSRHLLLLYKSQVLPNYSVCLAIRYHYDNTINSLQHLLQSFHHDPHLIGSGEEGSRYWGYRKMARRLILNLIFQLSHSKLYKVIWER